MGVSDEIHLWLTRHLYFTYEDYSTNGRYLFATMCHMGQQKEICSQICIIVEVVRKLHAIGAELVYDQGANNKRALANLGSDKNNPKINIDLRTIYTCFDPPHLLKCLRNNFMNTKTEMFVSNKRIRWYNVVQTNNIDQGSMTKSFVKTHK